MDIAITVIVTSLLTAALTAVLIWRLWLALIQPELRSGADEIVEDLERRANLIVDDLEVRAKVVVDDFEVRARELGDELGAQATEQAKAELTEAAEALIPRFRYAVRDGIQDAFLMPPTDRLGRTAKDVTSVGVNVIESTMRRILGSPPSYESSRASRREVREADKADTDE